MIKKEIIKRIVCFAMAALMAGMTLVGIVGCKKDDQPDESATSDVTPENTDPGTPENDDTKLELPEDLYYDGQAFTMLLRSDRNGAPDEFDVNMEAATVDVVDKAVFDRQMSIQEALGVTFVYNYVLEGGTDSTKEGIIQTITNSVSGGSTNDFDVACPGAYQAPVLAMNGLTYNWNDVPYINTDKVWWGSRSGMADALTVNGNLPFVSGDASNLSIGKAMAMFFNKELLEVYCRMSDAQLYELVKSGDWTIDKLIELSKKGTVELDGKTGASEEDMFGCNFYLATICDNYFAAFDIPVVSKDSFGEYEINLNTSRMHTAVEKLQELCYGANCTWMGTDKYNCIKFFSEKQHAIFTHGGLEWAPEIMKKFQNYGIIPYPKLDTDQQTYKTTLSDVYSVFVISKNASTDTVDKIGGVMEYMGYISYEKTTYAYYDVLLKGRAAQDTESVAMLDLIHDGICYDLGFIYSTALDWVVQDFRKVLDKPENSIGTWITLWAQKGTKYNGKLDDLMETLGTAPAEE